MIAGLLLRHYKIYEGINFIPICNMYENQYSLFIGNNGAGKSSVLEALDTYFNDSYWNRNKRGKKDETFIAPVFMINIEEYKARRHGEVEEAKFLEFLSNYFWNVTDAVSANLRSEEFKVFFNFRDKLKEKYNTEKFYFFILGMEYENKSKVYFSTFNDDLIRNIPEDCKTFDYNRLFDFVRKYYAYIYLPVETATSDILRLENKEMQELMSTDILSNIDEILTAKVLMDGKKRFSILDSINGSLNNYVDSINSVIQTIDPEYAFKVEDGFKKNLTSSDVRGKILEAYFSIRTLKKDNKEIGELSSGEQRIALIDVATAFLLESTNTDKNVVLAIDEPETSLHISKCFNQFQRLEKLAINNQIILTTHWYGALPISNMGSLQHLEKQRKVNVRSFDLPSYFEQRKDFPEDVLLKSYFELTSSILSSVRIEETNWIICEGSDDKKYLEFYLGDIHNLKILAVGGSGNVIKLYKYLFVPFSEKSEIKSIESKILCLTDTDSQVHTLDIPPNSRDDKLKIARIQIDPNNRVEIKKLGQGEHYPTEIEDCLVPQYLFEAFQDIIVKFGSPEENDAINAFEFDDGCPVSRIKGEKSILKPKNLEAIKKKHYLYDVIDNYDAKYLIAEKYVQLVKVQEDSPIPELFTRIREFIC